MTRPSYHHGDLANALTAAATELAREGGPEAVVLREAARKVGVSATAAYRHFASHGELLHAVKSQAAEQLATCMRTGLAEIPASPDPAAHAVQRVRALGLGYLRFATDQPGLFRTAFCNPTLALASPGPPTAWAELDLDMALVAPFQMLVETIDELVDAGGLTPARRPGAEIFAWSAVHGLAMLMLDGPLRTCTPPERELFIERVLDGVAVSLTAP